MRFPRQKSQREQYAPAEWTWFFRKTNGKSFYFPPNLKKRKRFLRFFRVFAEFQVCASCTTAIVRTNRTRNGRSVFLTLPEGAYRTSSDLTTDCTEETLKLTEKEHEKDKKWRITPNDEYEKFHTVFKSFMIFFERTQKNPESRIRLRDPFSFLYSASWIRPSLFPARVLDRLGRLRHGVK